MLVSPEGCVRGETEKWLFRMFWEFAGSIPI